MQPRTGTAHTYVVAVQLRTTYHSGHAWVQSEAGVASKERETARTQDTRLKQGAWENIKTTTVRCMGSTETTIFGMMHRYYCYRNYETTKLKVFWGMTRCKRCALSRKFVPKSFREDENKGENKRREVRPLHTEGGPFHQCSRWSDSKHLLGIRCHPTATLLSTEDYTATKKRNGQGHQVPSNHSVTADPRLFRSREMGRDINTLGSDGGESM